MKNKIYRLILFSTSVLCVVSLFGQNVTDKNTAQKFNLFAGYGTHGIVCGGNLRFATTSSGKSGTRLYFDIGYQEISFDRPLTFKGEEHNSDTKIISYDAGLAQEFYLLRGFHFVLFAGVRFDVAQFKDDNINETIGDGELVRYWNDIEVGKRLKKDYGNSLLAFDVGCCLNIKLSKRLWLIGKAAISPVKYDSNNSMYGKYWADTEHLNNFAINRSIYRVEALLSYGF